MTERKWTREQIETEAKGYLRFLIDQYKLPRDRFNEIYSEELIENILNLLAKNGRLMKLDIYDEVDKEFYVEVEEE